MHGDSSVDPRRCLVHGLTRVEKFSGPYDPNSSNARLSWWECPLCVPPASAPAATAELIAPKPCVCGHQHEWGIVNGEPTVLPACRAESDSGLRCSCRKYAPAAPSGEEADYGTAAEWKAAWLADTTRLKAAYDAQATELAALRARVEGYREAYAKAVGYHLISEEATFRPDAASYVKPSELDGIVEDICRAFARARAALAPRQTTET